MPGKGSIHNFSIRAHVSDAQADGPGDSIELILRDRPSGSTRRRAGDRAPGELEVPQQQNRQSCAISFDESDEAFACSDRSGMILREVQPDAPIGKRTELDARGHNDASLQAQNADKIGARYG